MNPLVSTSFGKLSQSFKLKPLPEMVFFQEGPGLRKWQWTDEGMKVINVTNILGDGSIDVTNTSRHISLEEFNERYSHFAVDDGDTVVASSGNTYGKVGRINKKHLPLVMNTSVIRFKPVEPNVLDSNYLYAFLRSHLFQNQIESFVIGSAQPNFGPSHLKMMLIPVPPFQIQKKIASIISAYDSLIENNTRRIQILEEMAQTIYNEWFVKFMFPGHENVKMVESEFGMIPEGWEVKNLEDVYDTSSGGTPSRKISEYYDGYINWVKTKELNDSYIFDTEEKITQLGLDKSSAKLFPENTVIMAMYGATIGQLGILSYPSTTNQACCAILRKDDTYTHFYAYLYLLTNRNKIKSLGMGAAQQNISQQVIKKLQILTPTKDIISKFDLLVTPMFESLKVLSLKNINLQSTRDLLLPKIISGEIDVSELDIDVGGITA